MEAQERPVYALQEAGMNSNHFSTCSDHYITLQITREHTAISMDNAAITQVKFENNKTFNGLRVCCRCPSDNSHLTAEDVTMSKPSL